MIFVLPVAFFFLNLQLLNSFSRNCLGPGLLILLLCRPVFAKNYCICLTIQIAPCTFLPTVFVCLKKLFLLTFDLCNIPQGSDIYKSNENLHLPLMTRKRMAGLSGDQQILLLPSEHSAANIHSSSCSEFALKHISAIGCVSGCFRNSSTFWAKALTFGTLARQDTCTWPKHIFF